MAICTNRCRVSPGRRGKMLANPFSDLVMDAVRRATGPLKFRFILQPSVAILLAIRSGLKDSRLGRPAFFWEFCVHSANRRQLLRSCWKSIGRLFILAFALDCIYQMIATHRIHFYGALIVAFVLAVIPYVIVRGPVNRIATALRRPPGPRAGGKSEQPLPLRKAS